MSDDALGENNRLFLDEAEAEGLPARRTRRYERGCHGSGQCLTGCPHAAKQAMNVSYVPWALALGARIFCSCRVDRIFFRSGRAAGVFASACASLEDFEHGRASVPSVRVKLHARRGVLVAASTIQTPELASSERTARGSYRPPLAQCHPGFAIAGVFGGPVATRLGATQGGESLYFRSTERIKLETLQMPPELAIVRFPGIGQELMRHLGTFANLAIWAVVVRSDAEGTVREGWGGRDKVNLTLTRSDIERTRKGAALLARILFEAGAREVWPGIFGIPSVLRSLDEVRAIEGVPPDPQLFNMITTHLFGAARMGTDPNASVVGPDFQVHETRGLYVVDSSVFPTNLGVNPQHSIMAMSRFRRDPHRGRPLRAVAPPLDSSGRPRILLRRLQKGGRLSKRRCSSVVEQLFRKQQVAGSIPIIGSKRVSPEDSPQSPEGSPCITTMRPTAARARGRR